MLPEVERERLDAFEEIGSERREVLERRPTSVVIKMVLKQFVRRSDKNAFTTEVLLAETPELLIPPGISRTGFFSPTRPPSVAGSPSAQTPGGIFARWGSELNRSSLCAWHEVAPDLAQPDAGRRPRTALRLPGYQRRCGAGT